MAPCVPPSMAGCGDCRPAGCAIRSQEGGGSAAARRNGTTGGTSQGRVAQSMDLARDRALARLCSYPQDVRSVFPPDRACTRSLFPRLLLAQHDPPVLHRSDEPILNLLPPQPPPARSLEPLVVRRIGEASFLAQRLRRGRRKGRERHWADEGGGPGALADPNRPRRRTAPSVVDGSPS